MSTEDNEPKKKRPYEIGQDLSDLSIDDINEVIGQLQAEIERLQSDAKQKNASKSAADALFNR